MNKISKKTFNPIDQEEKELMASIESDEWQPVKDFEAENQKAVNTAQNTPKNESI